MSQTIALSDLISGLDATEFAPEIPFELGGDCPLEKVSAFRLTDPCEHWLYITTGLAQFGQELTLRIKSSEEAAPEWPFELLNAVARRIFGREEPIEANNFLPLGSPIVREADCFLTTLFFTQDCELKGMDSIDFLQVCAITHDEEMAARGWKLDKFAQLLTLQVPKNIIDLKRFSLLKNENIKAAFQRGRDKDGSDTQLVPCGQIMFQVTDATTAYIQIDALAAEYLESVLPGRLPHGQDLIIISEEHNIKLIPSDTAMVKGVDDCWAEIYLTPSMYQQMMEQLKLRVQAFFFDEFENIRFSINDYRIKDTEGRTVGVKQWR